MAFPGLEFSFLAKFFKFFKRLSLFEEIIIPGFQEEGEILEVQEETRALWVH